MFISSAGPPSHLFIADGTLDGGDIAKKVVRCLDTVDNLVAVVDVRAISIISGQMQTH